MFPNSGGQGIRWVIKVTFFNTPSLSFNIYIKVFYGDHPPTRIFPDHVKFDRLDINIKSGVYSFLMVIPLMIVGSPFASSMALYPISTHIC